MGNTCLWRACYRALFVLILPSRSNLEMSDVGNVATAVCALKGFFSKATSFCSPIDYLERCCRDSRKPRSVCHVQVLPGDGQL